MTARCTRFANQLRGRFGLPVDYAEERLTSVEAEERLRESEERLRLAFTASNQGWFGSQSASSSSLDGFSSASWIFAVPLIGSPPGRVVERGWTRSAGSAERSQQPGTNLLQQVVQRSGLRSARGCSAAGAPDGSRVSRLRVETT